MIIIHQLQKRLECVKISHRIAIGNALIIILGAIGGTLVTRHLAREAADLWLILLFATIGITLTVLLNCGIIHTALRPLRELNTLVERLQGEPTTLEQDFLKNTDPDIVQLATTLTSLVQQLEERTLKLQAFSKRAINAQEEERKRIARGLHDETAQALSILIINLEKLENTLPLDNPKLQARLASTREITTHALKDLRHVIYGLRPTILDDLGLLPAIRWYARSTLEEARIQVEVNALGESFPLSAHVNTTLFRIAQEAINNIVRHADTRTAVITLFYKPSEVSLRIDDDGRGFDVAQITNSAVRLQRLGLVGIQERAELIGGQVVVESTPGEGTRIQVCVPLRLVKETPE